MARRRRSNDDALGIVYLILIIAAIYLITWILRLVLSFVNYVFDCAIKYGPFIILFIIAIILCCIIFYFTHRKPLTYKQITKLSRKYARKYVKETYQFQMAKCSLKPYLKSYPTATGCWYDIEEPISSFPAGAANLLDIRGHIGVVIGIEKDGIVHSMWVNNGENYDCDLTEIVSKCQEIGGYTIMRFHNLPSSGLQQATALRASEQSKASALACAENVCQLGINWYDFICNHGQYDKFYSRISDSFEVDGKSISNIIDRIGITPRMDFEFQKEYLGIGSFKDLFKKTALILAIIIAVILFLLGSIFALL